MFYRQMETRKWQELDQAHYLHPFTDHKALRQTGSRVAVRGEGVHVWDTEGRKIIDGLSGLGCVNIGYGRPELVAAASAQMSDLSFCQSFFNTTHPAAVLLAEKLVKLTPEGLNHVFFQCSGSEANETAVRAIRRYWDLKGQPGKKLIIAREYAYHGSTHLAASLSGLEPMHHAGGDVPMPVVHRIKTAYPYREKPAAMPDDEFGRLAASWLEDKILELGPENVAAFFAEPAQSAGGSIVPPMSYWPAIQDICRKYDVLLALDEVVMGFGRTGKWFGSFHYGITPDLMQIGKGLTSGYLPLSACLMSDRVADVLIDKGGEWAHGYTYSGHPSCCAVALANIEVIESEGLIENAAQTLIPHFEAGLAEFTDHPLVGDVRSVGLMAGLELVADRATGEAFDGALQVGQHCSAEGLSRGLAFRANGDSMALMPPLVMTVGQMDEMFAIVRAALDATARHLGMA
ncbi:aminotransferase [Actibacterium sp. D379-3]